MSSWEWRVVSPSLSKLIPFVTLLIQVILWKKAIFLSPRLNQSTLDFSLQHDSSKSRGSWRSFWAFNFRVDKTSYLPLRLICCWTLSTISKALFALLWTLLKTWTFQDLIAVFEDLIFSFKMYIGQPTWGCFHTSTTIFLISGCWDHIAKNLKELRG